MVFSSAWLAAAARLPAEACQGQPRAGRRRLRADEVLRALFLPPVQELERLADCLFLFFCLPLPDSYYYMSGSGRGGWAPRPPREVLYSYRRSLSTSSSSSSSSTSSEDYYYSDD